MMFDMKVENMKIVNVPKGDVRITWQTMETMINFINPKGTSILHGKQWVNLMRMMTDIWPRGWYHKVINF